MFYFILYFPLLFAFVVGGLGFEFCVSVAGWRHALRSEWPFIIIIITTRGWLGVHFILKSILHAKVNPGGHLGGGS